MKIKSDPLLHASFHTILLPFYSHSSSAGTKPGSSESFRCPHDVPPPQAAQHSVSSAPHSHLQTYRQALLHSGGLHFTGKSFCCCFFLGNKYMIVLPYVYSAPTGCWLFRTCGASAKFKCFQLIMGSRQRIRMDSWYSTLTCVFFCPCPSGNARNIPSFSNARCVRTGGSQDHRRINLTRLAKTARPCQTW